MFYVTKLMILSIFMISFTDQAAEDKAVYYTPEKIQAARDNVKKYDWAKKIEQRIFKGDVSKYYTGPEYASVEKLLAKSDDFIWMFQPTTTIPRVFPHDTRGLCPVCGDAARNISFWCPWEIEPFEHPYKIKCKSCGTWFPSNDYQNGDMTSGKYPDDGNGILVNGKRYYMLREYVDYVYLSYVVPALSSLSQAYLLTGDKTYAKKACILLARVASEYPNYEDRFERTYCGAYGGTHPFYKWKKGGMITDFIWENFYLIKTALAYDALKEYMSDDQETIKFLNSKGIAAKNGEELKTFIKESIFRPAMKALLKGLIQGNEGIYQASSLAVAMVMDDYGDLHPNTKDMVDFVYYGDGHSAYVIENTVLPDGGGHESPGYHTLKLKYIEVADFMEIIRKRNPEKYPAEKYPDIWGGPKGRKVFDYFIDSLICGFAVPSIGDSGAAYPSIDLKVLPAKKRFSCITAKDYVFAADKFNDPLFAYACFDDAGKTQDGNLWAVFPEAKLKALAKKLDKRNDTDIKARLLDTYGAAILEKGKYPDGKGFSINYSNLKNHWQADALTVDLYAFNRDMLPDLGYPVSWNHTRQWDYHNMAHNTVTVDETFQQGNMGLCRFIAASGDFQAVAVSHAPYPRSGKNGECSPSVNVFERIDIMSDVDKENFYVIDIFSVNGGRQHDQSWHSIPVAPNIPDLKWVEQKGGTLAGAEVKQFAEWTDAWGRKRNDFPSYVTDIKKAPLDKQAAWTWNSGLPAGEALKIHIVPLSDNLQAIMGKGRSPVWPAGKYVDYLFVRRENTSGSLTTYLTVLEPYRKNPFIKEIAVKSVSPLIITVSHEKGTDEFTVNIPAGDSGTMALRPLGIRKLSSKDGKVSTDLRLGDWNGKKEGYASAKISNVDYEKNKITVSGPPAELKEFKKDANIRIHNDKRSSCYTVTAVELKDGAAVLTLKDTALLARGLVDNIFKEGVQINSNIVFALGGSGNFKNGKIENTSGGQITYAGTYLNSPEREAQRLAGATPDGKFIFEKELSADENAGYKGCLISVWQYGKGDTVEMPLLRNMSEEIK